MYFFITIILVVIYYFNGIKYVDLNINIANRLRWWNRKYNKIKSLNLKNYVIFFNGIVFLIAIFTLFKKLRDKIKFFYNYNNNNCFPCIKSKSK